MKRRSKEDPVIQAAQTLTQTRELAGRTALVTGAGSGLGAAIARRLAAAGATVVAADIRADAVERLQGELGLEGMQVDATQLDVSDEASATERFRELVGRHGALDVLVNNAGVDRTASVTELDVADFDRVLAVNLRGPFILSRLALEQMGARRHGHIVNIVSTAAKRAWPNASAYHASKWGLLGLTHALHAEAREMGVKVTAVVAGGMRTPFLLDRFPDLDRGLLQDPANVADTVRYVLTQPDETVIPEVMVLPMRETSWP
jgi:NAD(P)-dependent dehydrogenase (short-subunit alcohol dehydrogenase family)